MFVQKIRSMLPSFDSVQSAVDMLKLWLLSLQWHQLWNTEIHWVPETHHATQQWNERVKLREVTFLLSTILHHAFFFTSMLCIIVCIIFYYIKDFTNSQPHQNFTNVQLVINMLTVWLSMVWKYLFTVSYTMKCMAGLVARTRDGFVPFHNVPNPSYLAIFHKQSTREEYKTFLCMLFLAASAKTNLYNMMSIIYDRYCIDKAFRNFIISEIHLWWRKKTVTSVQWLT